MNKNTVVVEQVTVKNGKQYGIVKVQQDALRYLQSKGETIIKSVRGHKLVLVFGEKEIAVPCEISNGRKYIDLVMGW